VATEQEWIISEIAATILNVAALAADAPAAPAAPVVSDAHVATPAVLARFSIADGPRRFTIDVTEHVWAPAAFACFSCNVQPATTEINGVTYYYQTGGCGTPQSNSWGNEDCHTQYQVIAGGQLQTVVYCEEYGYECYYTDVGGGGVGGGGSWGGDGGGPRDDDTGACSAEYAYCY